MASIVENNSMPADVTSAVEVTPDSDQIDLIDKLTIEESSSDATPTTTPVPVLLETDMSKNGSEESLLVNIDTKQRKKLDKLFDGLFKKASTKSAPQFSSIEEKFYALAQKYVDSQEANKKLQSNGKDVEKTVANLTKQRDQIQAEYGKQLLVKTKLESLCRELQRQNKIVKEESIQRIEEEEKKRKEISNKFQGAIDEINQSVASNSEKNNTLIQENVQLTTKLKNLIDQYEIREQHIEKVLKHKDLEVQLANAKLQQSELKIVELTERAKKEKNIYESHIVELTKKCEFHQESETQLKSQVTLYTQKYEEFQSTLSKSNQVFESFRVEMDKLTKKIKKLEQENVQWKNKLEASEASFQKSIKQREELEEKAKKSQAKADIMEQLSRSLQTERNNFKQTIKELEEKINGGIANDEKDVAVAAAAAVEEATETTVSTDSVTTVVIDNQLSNSETTPAQVETSVSQ